MGARLAAPRQTPWLGAGGKTRPSGSQSITQQNRVTTVTKFIHCDFGQLFCSNVSSTLGVAKRMG